MGVVLKTWDGNLHRFLAKKVILRRAEPDASAKLAPADVSIIRRFREEAQITGQLDHPGIVPVHELGLDDQGRAYFTMRLVRGRELREIFDLVHKGDQDWTLTRALGVMLKVCDAMAFAHAKSVIHRDLKPSNVMVGRFGEVYVMDWGIARVLGREDLHDLRIAKPEATPGADPLPSLTAELRTQAGDVKGTPEYMSLEQAEGRVEELDRRTDVYSVGAMLYHLLTGCRPYVAKGDSADAYMILARVREGSPTPIRALKQDVPPELEAICEQAMQRDPKDRYPDMQELADDLRAFLEDRVVKAYQTGALAELKKWYTRNKQLARAAGAAVVLLIAGLSVTLWLTAATARAQKGVLRLSALQDLEDLRRRADELWPVEPRPRAGVRGLVGGRGRPHRKRGTPGPAREAAPACRATEPGGDCGLPGEPCQLRRAGVVEGQAGGAGACSADSTR